MKLTFYRLVNSPSHPVLSWLSCVTVLSPVTTLCVTGRHVFLMSISKKITQTSRFSRHFFFIKTLKSSCLFLIHNLWAIWENSKLLFWFLYSQNFQTKIWIDFFTEYFSLKSIWWLDQWRRLAHQVPKGRLSYCLVSTVLCISHFSFKCTRQENGVRGIH